MPVDINRRSLEEFGRKVREIRDKKRWTQEEVAKNVGISETYYAGIERGEQNLTFSVMEKICKVLNVRSSQILPF
jgi:transcriptional regulator with XRE-family HTH domain